MVIIQVEEKDLDEAFEILSNNGRFVGLSHNRFQISENGEGVLKKLEEKEIKVKIIDEKEGVEEEEAGEEKKE